MERVMVNIRDYRPSFKKLFDNKDLVSIEELLSAVEDLENEKEWLEEKIRDMESEETNDEYIPENYL